MPTMQVDTDKFGTATGADSLDSGQISDCVVIAVHKQVDGADQVCMWHIGGGNIEEGSSHHAAVKNFVAPRCTVHVALGHMHMDPDYRQRWIKRAAFESLLENSEVMPAPGATPPNARVIPHYDVHSFAIAANGATTVT